MEATTYSKIKKEALQIAEAFLKIPDSMIHPKAYIIGDPLFSSACGLLKAAINREQNERELHIGITNLQEQIKKVGSKPDKYKQGINDIFLLSANQNTEKERYYLIDYYILTTLWGDLKQFMILYDFAQNHWIKRQDNFLPEKWPNFSLASCNSLLEACLSFSCTIAMFTKESFDGLEKQKPQKLTSFIKNAFENLFKTLQRVYSGCEIPNADEIKRLLEIEYGLYGRRGNELHYITAAVAKNKYGVSKSSLIRYRKDDKIKSQPGKLKNSKNLYCEEDIQIYFSANTPAETIESIGNLQVPSRKK